MKYGFYVILLSINVQYITSKLLLHHFKLSNLEKQIVSKYVFRV